MGKRALLYVNRHAREGQGSLAQAIQELHALDFELLPVPTPDIEQLSKAIRQHQDQLDLVVVGGGDGTFNAIADSLIETQLPLGMLPLGTANDLARTLGIPTSIPEACQVIATGHPHPIDMGCVNGKHFFNVASMGLSVQITQQLSSRVKRRFGSLAYAIAALQAIWKTRPFHAEIRVNGEFIPVKTVQIAVGNGRYYGGGMAIAEDATIDDQQLDLYSLEIKHLWQIVPLILTIQQGQQALLPWVRDLRNQEIEIRTAEPLAINTDGEITTHTPAKFHVVPQALSVIVPTVSETS
ncbi:MAG TPA: lipid kinase [Crinalium sp.]|jgi:YegS/Rv2252/BmrU family lipid kinase